MSYYRRRLVGMWFVLGASFVVPVAICVALFVVTPEYRPAIAIAAISFVGYCAAIASVLFRGNRIGDAVRRTANPGSVVFGAFNHPGALVHVGAYVLPDAHVARGLSYIVVFDEVGLSYLAPGKPPEPFVRVPWADIVRLEEAAGELAVTLHDGETQFIVPGARLPMGARRVRALAAEVSRLQLARQP